MRTGTSSAALWRRTVEGSDRGCISQQGPESQETQWPEGRFLRLPELCGGRDIVLKCLFGLSWLFEWREKIIKLGGSADRDQQVTAVAQAG